MFYQPPQRFPRGSLDVSIDFDEPGGYIGVLTAVDEQATERREYVSVFPFSVGVTDWWARSKWILASLAVGALLYFWTARSGRVSNTA